MLQDGVYVSPLRKKKVRFAKAEKSVEKEKYRKTPRFVVGSAVTSSTRKHRLTKKTTGNNVTRRI